MTNQIGLYNHDTGEQVVREMTNEEQAIRDKEVADWLEAKAIKEAELAQAEAAKAAAEAKLAALGLTADDLKALGLGNN
jgi:regulator of protease activity HflC (stomatin/prohibitin superfamily)